MDTVHVESATHNKNPERQNMKKVLIIDICSLFRTAFYGAVTKQHTGDRKVQYAVEILLEFIFLKTGTGRPDYIAAVFESGKKQDVVYENMILEDMEKGFTILQAMISSMQIFSIKHNNASHAVKKLAFDTRNNGFQTEIITGNKNLLQAAAENTIICIPKYRNGRFFSTVYNREDIKREHGIFPEQFADLSAIAGNITEGIKPIHCDISKKLALALIREYQTAEGIVFAHESIFPEEFGDFIYKNRMQIFHNKRMAGFPETENIKMDLAQASAYMLYTKEAQMEAGKWALGRIEQILRVYETTGMECVYEIKEISKKDEFPDITGVKQESIKRASVMLFADKEYIQAFTGNLQNKNILSAAAVYMDDTVYFAAPSSSLSEYEITQWILQLYISKTSLSVFFLKEQLHILNVLGRKHNLDSRIPDSRDKFFDCSIAAYLLNPSLKSYGHDAILQEYMGIQETSWKTFIGKSNVSIQAAKKYDVFLNMACLTVWTAQKLYSTLLGKMQEQGMDMLFWDIEMRIIPVLYRIENAGIKAVRGRIEDCKKMLDEKIKDMQTNIYETARQEFNINSSRQVSEAMETFSGDKRKNLLKMISKYRSYVKLKSSYTDKLLSFIHEDDRIHCQFQQKSASTGRISCSSPNMQSIPLHSSIGKQIRSAFIPKDGCIFIDADYSQIELRILAHMSGDARLENAYKKGCDIHKITAAQIFHTAYDEVTREQRDKAKAVNYSIIYGISSYGLAQELHISKEEAEEYMNRYFSAYPQIKHYLDSLIHEGKNAGYVKTMTGRRRYVPELMDAGFKKRIYGQRAAMNSPVQGTAADIMKTAMIRVDRMLREKKLQASIVLQVHDELLVEAPADEADAVKQILKEGMEQAASLSIPLIADIKDGYRWSEVH